MQYFTVKTITPAIKSITDLTKVRSFLIEGKEKALLVDTGTGIGYLGEFVKTLTDKPLYVMCTHGHPDHVGAAEEFDEVFLNRKDFDRALHACSLEKRREYAAFILGGEKDIDIDKLYFVPCRVRQYQALEPGTVFDLGGITATAVAFPGHTQGMMAVWIREERSVILGDACNRRVFLFSEEASSVEEYRDACAAFRQEYGAHIETFYMSHGPETLDIRLVQNMIETCDDILSGKDDRIEIDFMGERAYLAKRELEPGTRADGKTGNIAYALHKIYRCR